MSVVKKLFALVGAALLVGTAAPQVPNFATNKNAGIHVELDGSNRRNSNPNFSVSYDPFFHNKNDTGTSPPDDTSFTLQTGVAFAQDLSARVSVPAEANGLGVISVAVQTGPLPDGLTLQTDVACEGGVTAAYCLKGTPTTVQSRTVTYRATFDPTLGSNTTADQDYSYNVTNPDTTGPAAPGNFTCAASSGGTSTSAITCTWTPPFDASGLGSYDVRYSTASFGCTSGSAPLVTGISASATSFELTGLSPSETRELRVRARDTLGNIGTFSSCVSATTAASGGGGGGGGGGASLYYNGTFESYPVETWSSDGSDVDIDSIVRTSMDGGSGDVFTGTVSSPTSSGSRAMKSTITKDASNSFRAEITLKNTTNLFTAIETEDMWFRVDIYLVGNASTRNTSSTEGIVMQWHAPKGGTNPVLTIDENGSGTWRVRKRYSSTDCVDHSTVTTSTLHTSSVTYNTWVRWDFQVRWDYRSAGNGFVRVWKDGTQVVNNTGPVGCNDTKGSYLKIGNYSSTWRQSGVGTNGAERTQYHDNVKIAVGNGLTRSVLD